MALAAGSMEAAASMVVVVAVVAMAAADIARNTAPVPSGAPV